MWTSFGVAVVELVLSYLQLMPSGTPDWVLLAAQSSLRSPAAPTVASTGGALPQNTAVGSGPFHWTLCPDHADDARYQCGYLTVPLDHLDPTNNATLDIAVQKYISNATVPLGTILLNPGGPGGPGTSMATPATAIMTGGQYDVLGFDPRGIGKSRPIQCSKNRFTAAIEGAVLDTVDLDGTSESAIDAYVSNYALPIARCQLYDGDYLPYLSTAFVARDMDLIRAALGQDLMHYYGISYGTFLGATYVSMFPDRVGRVVIDSVLDPEVYTGPVTNLLLRSYKDNDACFTAFTEQCEAAGPLHCPLADANATRPYLMKRLQAFLTAVETKPLLVKGGDDLVRVTATEIRQTIFGSMYTPHDAWPPLAATLHAMLNGTYEAPSTNSSCATLDADRDVHMASIAYIGNDGASSKGLNLSAAVQAAQKLAPLSGLVGFVNLVAAKAWTTRPVERFTGPWTHTLANKVLVLTNQVDPATPMVGAQNVHRLLGTDNAVLVTREGYGHGALFSQPSTCVHKLVAAYYSNGTLPSTTFCKIDATPFGPSSPLSDAMQAMMTLSTSITKPTRMY
ncbi:hypothetical protein SDRG_07621 [Saprolegnia diclina VS20]|uniref:AB hydrolase-1 domain-containing protein n=1 Tax=Saprolegnia diclina (strain VS20) TaxID=1156394 RepID=T0QJB9_SAPDV|nr:hypothetical protein SDRG_07621 [Saprolegnia diclina VS20]EQC34816.1 hypothetical protein SDRG_07621 [Saprolegnia diclina VS20]|eukprot:XP_008611688.1 hypothetical protein SDRG_07621 [Saprolegnia diclina VS20]